MMANPVGFEGANHVLFAPKDMAQEKCRTLCATRKEIRQMTKRKPRVDRQRNTIIRDNLMSREGYSPYCPNTRCSIMERTAWNGHQFKCHRCGWESRFEDEFIAEYKERWGLK